MTSRYVTLPLVLSAVLALGACTSDDASPEPVGSSPTATASPSVRATIAAAVADGTVSALVNPKSEVPIDALIARLNAIPGVLGAGYFAGESRIVVRLKADATAAQIAGVLTAIRAEASLSDITFEPPEKAASSPSPKSSPSPAPTRKPAATPSATSY